MHPQLVFAATMRTQAIQRQMLPLPIVPLALTQNFSTAVWLASDLFHHETARHFLHAAAVHQPICQFVLKRCDGFIFLLDPALLKQ